MDYFEINGKSFYDKYYLKTRLKIVNCILFTNGFVMNEEQKKLFLTFKFNRLQSLDLSNQDIDNEYIIEMSNNGILEHICTLKLQNNPKITSIIIDNLFEHKRVGNRRSLPAISGKHGMPYVTLDIYMCDKNIKETFKEYKKCFDFEIIYDGDKDICEGIKIVNIYNNYESKYQEKYLENY